MYSKTIRSVSFPIAWQEAAKFIRKSTEEFSFGGGKEIKHARDSQCGIILDRHAVMEVLSHTVHPSDPFATELKLQEYIKEYSDLFDASKFDYTYYNILKEGFREKIPICVLGVYDDVEFNQIDALRKGLQKQCDERLSSNRNVAVLWNPAVHTYSRVAQPCWNECMVRWIRDGEVQIYTHFRSHDISAWGSNMVAMMEFLNRDVVKPCGCEIIEIIESNFSLHAYESDLDMLNNIKELTVNPALQRLQDKYDRIGCPTIFDGVLDAFD